MTDTKLKSILDFRNVLKPGDPRPWEKPTDLRNVRGSPRTAPPLNDGKARPPRPPAWLDDGARAEWRRLAPLLAADWRPQCGDALALYCTLWAEWRRAPESFTAARLAQLRQMQLGLGIVPSTRKNRGW